MVTKINGVTFFTDNLVSTPHTAHKKFDVTQEYRDLFFLNNIYTLSNKRGFRISNNQKLFVGYEARIEPYTMFYSGSHFHSIGSFSSVYSALPVNTIVGRYCSIAQGVQRMGGSHPIERFTTSMLTYSKSICAFNDYLDDVSGEFEHKPTTETIEQPIIIGNDVWIGQNVLFSSKGITVGDGAIIAAGSLVTKDVPPYAIVGGNPAKVIRYRFNEDTIEKLLQLKWWQYGFADFKDISGDDPIEVFIEKIEKLVASGELKPFKPQVVTIQDFLKIENEINET